ncbi:two-component regulator propeller domain-containing protein [Bacteroidota bacterium]
MKYCFFCFKNLVIVVALLLLIGTSTAQQFYFDQYSVKEGLAQSKVYDLIQDHTGYIWIGTNSGVSRFDGMIFENFSSDDGLSENGVRVIYEDKNNNIWFGHTGGGISRFDGKIFENLNNDSILIEGDITAILEDQFSQIWIGSHGSGAFLIKNPESDIQNLQIKNYKGQQKLSDRVFSIIRTKTPVHN